MRNFIYIINLIVIILLNTLTIDYIYLADNIEYITTNFAMFTILSGLISVIITIPEMIIFIVKAIKNKNIDSNKRVINAVLIYFLNIFYIPYYLFLFFSDGQCQEK